MLRARFQFQLLLRELNFLYRNLRPRVFRPRVGRVPAAVGRHGIDRALRLSERAGIVAVIDRHARSGRTIIINPLCICRLQPHTAKRGNAAEHIVLLREHRRGVGCGVADGVEEIVSEKLR